MTARASRGPDAAPPTRPGTVLQGGRIKAYRPLPVGQRRRALADAVTAYARGDFFLAHEILEPAWMGTADELERFLYQGLIKLAAAYVHDVRGNPRGRAKNLVGARRFLGAVVEGGANDAGFDLPVLLDEIDGRLAEPPVLPVHEAPVLRRRAPRARSAV